MEWHVETAPPCEAHRATSKDVRATVHSSKSNMWLRKMHERGQTQSACLAAACKQSGPEAGRKQVFSGSDGGLGRAGVMVSDAIHGCHSLRLVSPQIQRWPCGTTLGYSPGIQSRSLLDVPCHCSFTQPSSCIRSLATAAVDIPLSQWGHHHEWPVPGAASLWHTLLVQKVFHWKLTAWQIWLPRK